MPASAPLLELRKVSKLYGPRLIFKDITCALPPASITLLAGANGAGKSTLLRIMAGLSRPTSGTAECRAAAGKLGYLGHATFIYPALSALENLLFWRRLYAMPADEDAALALLQRVELARYAHEKAGTFSRGMAQRLNLARVLQQEPEVLLLDEPATGLDARSAALLREEICAARERKACLLWISHSLREDAPLADRALCLHGRRLAFDGTPADGVAFLQEALQRGEDDGKSAQAAAKKQTRMACPAPDSAAPCCPHGQETTARPNGGKATGQADMDALQAVPQATAAGRTPDAAKEKAPC